MDKLRSAIKDEFEISRPLLDAMAAEELPVEPLILDPLLGAFVSDEPGLTK